jgi:hypothetical protein
MMSHPINGFDLQNFKTVEINAPFYLKRNRPPFSRLVREVQTHCVSAGPGPSHVRTIKARLKEMDPRANKAAELKMFVALCVP